MPTFLARRYRRPTEAVGKTEKVLGVAILLLLAGIVAAFAVHVGTNEDYLFNVEEAAYRATDEPGGVTPPQHTLPPPDDAQWQAPSQVAWYTPQTLYQKINGRADAYVQFHVVGLAFGTYRHRVDADLMIDVYWYDMGEPANAFGMYRSEASPDATPVLIGRDGYETGGAVFFWKGASYVQVLPTAFEKDDTDAARKIAERLAERIEDAGEDRWALHVLPEQRRVDGSFEYMAQDAFGLEFLTEVYAAKYDLDEGRVTLFVRRAEDAAGARALLDRYVESFEKYGRILWKDPDASHPMAAGEVAGTIDVVFAKGRHLGGVAGAQDADIAKRAAIAFYDELALP